MRSATPLSCDKYKSQSRLSVISRNVSLTSHCSLCRVHNQFFPCKRKTCKVESACNASDSKVLPHWKAWSPLGTSPKPPEGRRMSPALLTPHCQSTSCFPKLCFPSPEDFPWEHLWAPQSKWEGTEHSHPWGSPCSFVQHWKTMHGNPWLRQKTLRISHLSKKKPKSGQIKERNISYLLVADRQSAQS